MKTPAGWAIRDITLMCTLGANGLGVEASFKRVRAARAASPHDVRKTFDRLAAFFPSPGEEARACRRYTATEIGAGPVVIIIVTRPSGGEIW